MRFFKLVFYDIKHGLLKKWKWCIGILLMNFAFLLLFLLKLATYNKGARIQHTVPAVIPTFGDISFFIFAGMAEYIPQPDQSFAFPLIWLLLYIVLLWLTLEYTNNDLTTSGQQLLIRTHGRTLWWLSKCVWNFLCVLCFFILIWGEVLLFCIARGYPISLSMHAIFLESIIPAQMDAKGYLLPQLFSLFLVTPLVMYALSMFEMVLTLWVKPVASFAVTSGVLVVSAYKLSPLLIGNYAMPVRSSAFYSSGVDATTGVFLAGILIILSIVVGIVRFRKLDILPME